MISQLGLGAEGRLMLARKGRETADSDWGCDNGTFIAIAGNDDCPTEGDSDCWYVAIDQCQHRMGFAGENGDAFSDPLGFDCISIDSGGFASQPARFRARLSATISTVPTSCPVDGQCGDQFCQRCSQQGGQHCESTFTAVATAVGVERLFRLWPCKRNNGCVPDWWKHRTAGTL